MHSRVKQRDSVSIDHDSHLIFIACERSRNGDKRNERCCAFVDVYRAERRHLLASARSCSLIYPIAAYEHKSLARKGHRDWFMVAHLNGTKQPVPEHRGEWFYSATSAKIPCHDYRHDPSPSYQNHPSNWAVYFKSREVWRSVIFKRSRLFSRFGI